MFLFSKFFQIRSLAISAILLFQSGGKMPLSQVPQRAESSSLGLINVIIWTDQGKYTLGDSVRVNVALQNTSDATTYLDRRMFWTGFGGGLKLVISDEQGNALPARVLSDAIMPPPKEADTSILIRLDPGFFYGTWINLLVKDFLPKPGRYSIRVIYKSWLRKEFVAPQLRDLPAIWADAPGIASQLAWIDVTQ